MIATKLLQIQKEIKGLEKTSQAYNYKYVSGDKVLHEIRPRMDALGLLLIPSVDGIDNQPVTYLTTAKTGAVTQTTEVLTTLRMTMTWVDTEDGDTLAVKWAANGCNKFDKGFGSALTYGERYFLLKTFHIATDSDDVDYVSIERDKAIEEGLSAAAAQIQRAPDAGVWPDWNGQQTGGNRQNNDFLPF